MTAYGVHVESRRDHRYDLCRIVTGHGVSNEKEDFRKGKACHVCRSVESGAPPPKSVPHAAVWRVCNG
jgi:hypothetical protein